MQTEKQDFYWINDVYVFIKNFMINIVLVIDNYLYIRFIPDWNGCRKVGALYT